MGEDKRHNMRYIQAPINILMPEAFVEPWQMVENEEKTAHPKTLVAACQDLDLNLMSS